MKTFEQDLKRLDLVDKGKEGSSFEKTWEYCGLVCAVVMIIVDGKKHHRCGYVEVSGDHRFAQKRGDDLLEGVAVHGGITYSDNHLLGKKSKGWWIGFDCLHHGDSVHQDFKGETVLYSSVGHFWLQEEAEKETDRLAEALYAVKETT